MKTQATVSPPSAIPGSPLLEVSGALFGIIALILIAAWLARRMGFGTRSASARGLKVSASTTVGTRERVVIVDVDDARLVLGVTSGQITLLHKLPPAAAVNDAVNEKNADFQSLMKNLLKRSGRS